MITLSWLLPWYAIWALPLAPLARRRWVPVAALLLTALVVAIEIHTTNGRLHHHSRNVPALNVPGPGLPASLLRAGERVTPHRAARSLH